MDGALNSDLPQFTSSAPFSQSTLPSQCHVLGMHWLRRPAQLNSVGLHVLTAGSGTTKKILTEVLDCGIVEAPKKVHSQIRSRSTHHRYQEVHLCHLRSHQSHRTPTSV